jgi:hypothetical protein
MFLSEVVRWSWIVLAASFQVFTLGLSNTIGVARYTRPVTVKLFFALLS